LLYGNNDEASVIFKKQIDALATTNASRLKVVHVLANAPSGYAPLQVGLMTKEKTIDLIKNHVSLSSNNEYFICGPGVMMDNAKAALTELKIDETKIHIEYFTTPVSSDASAKQTASSAAGATATIVIDGDKHTVVLEENETILEAALRIGLDAPYACQGGSCCTCRALLEKGEVEMAVNYALSSSEVKQGYILTCQSRPKTDTVLVNYDKGL
jgi:ring-1,2-phenylacetyl-CoA epoxidase subunit PaaE